jgi:hypothetical protein
MTTLRDHEAFVAEVLRINDRFTQEVVEAFDICPFARGARIQGRAIREVVLHDEPEVEPSLAVIERLEKDPRRLEVVQVIYPRLDVTPKEFEHFNARLRNAHAARTTNPVFVHATFHPDYGCDTRTPDALVMFFRRAPDPTIQLVRFSTIQSVRKHEDRGTIVMDPSTFDWTKPPPPPPPTIPEKITRDNYDRVMRDGPEVIDRIYADIRKDRDASYTRFRS